jgi:hypothetical protein
MPCLLISLFGPCSYKEAASIRDLLTQLEKESRKAQALAAEFSGFRDTRLKLGQRIIHKVHGYRSVGGWVYT